MYREIFVILTVVTTSQFVAARNNETLPKPHVIIVGPTGAGKSSLACALTGGDPTSETCLFPVCHNMDSCTKNTSYCGNTTWIGDESNPLFTVVDTPGFEDSDDQMDELIEEMTDVLNNDVKTADVVLLTIPEDTTRFTSGLIDMLKQLEMLFGRKMWNSTMIEISKFSYDPDDIEDREEDCEEEDDDECRDEAFFYREINRELEKNFHLGMNLSMVFIDSYARKDKNLDDEVQQQHFLEETDKLWEFAKNTPEFKFKTVDEVLEENAIMRDEIICLNGIINDELNKTLEDMKQLKEQLQQEITERKMSDDAMIGALEQETNDRIANYDEVSAEIAGNVTALNKNITEVQDDVDHIQTSPLGSIIAWVNKPNEAAENETLSPPAGWVLCDGNVIPHPSIWAGSPTPDLNGEKRFLRGGDYDSVLSMEEDMMQDHKHKENEHYHQVNASASTEFTITDAYRGIHGSVHDDANGESFDEPDSDLSFDHRYYAPFVSVNVTNLPATCGTQGVDSKYRYGSETRPKNMNVQWIIKVW